MSEDRPGASEPAASSPEEAGQAFAELVRIMDRLRSPGGCPWDGEQSHESLVRYLIEESYEVIEAIEGPCGVDAALLREELGDVLLQVVFHARIAAERPGSDGGFGILEVIEGLTEKLTRRHPQVFSGQDDAEDRAEEGAAGGEDLENLARRWEEIKKVEKPERRGPFDGIPPALPALASAEKTLNKAAKAGLELPGAVVLPGWETASEPQSEGYVEASPESVTREQRSVAAERAVGEHLLAVVRAARSLGVDPERALRQAVRAYRNGL